MKYRNYIRRCYRECTGAHMIGNSVKLQAPGDVTVNTLVLTGL